MKGIGPLGQQRAESGDGIEDAKRGDLGALAPTAPVGKSLLLAVPAVGGRVWSYLVRG